MTPVLHLIADLEGFGGTEATLLRIVERSRLGRDGHLVVSMRGTGTAPSAGSRLADAGIEVVALGIHGALDAPAGLARLARILDERRPRVVSAWLYHANAASAWVRMLRGRGTRIVWNVRSLPFVRLRDRPGRWAAQRLGAAMSGHVPDEIVWNSHASMRAHVALGFAPRSAHVVPNGVECEAFRPDAHDRARIRAELGIAAEDVVIGCVGRKVPEKGHAVLAKALADPPWPRPGQAGAVRLLACGEGVVDGDEVLAPAARRALGAERVHLLGRRDDTMRLYRAMDLLVLPSISESFPNVVVEAMASGLPCVATDVGAVRDVLPEGNAVVPAGDASALRRAMDAMVGLQAPSRARIGTTNRARAIAEFSVGAMVDRFDALFARGVADADPEPSRTATDRSRTA
jgi:glycosyltransferase involved in cell wall biosynthesis